MTLTFILFSETKLESNSGIGTYTYNICDEKNVNNSYQLQQHTSYL